jgi:hypothetical protein
MTGVLLRCSNCGASQASPGECQTCHAGEVRYFCSNHEPGRWLAGPVCLACGARFAGEAYASGEAAALAAERAPTLDDQRALAGLKRRLAAHELLLRALLTHLAMTSPDSFGALVGELVRSRRVPDEVARDITALVEDVAASLR